MHYDKSEKDPTVVKANSLIQAGYRLTRSEQRVMLSAISQIGKDDEPTDQTTYEVTANALADITGVGAHRAYESLKEAAHRLYNRAVRIEHGPNGNLNGPKGRITMTRWVQEIDYVPDEGRIELRFAHSILPYLSLLKREFTSYKLRNVARMNSTHGVRLYELLQQWRQTGERELELDDLRRMFGITGRYKSIKDLKKYVIEKAVQDVNEYSDLQVDWGHRKNGRRVVAIQFRFAPKSNGSGQKKTNYACPVSPDDAVTRSQRPAAGADPNDPESKLIGRENIAGQVSISDIDSFVASVRETSKSHEAKPRYTGASAEQIKYENEQKRQNKRSGH